MSLPMYEYTEMVGFYRLSGVSLPGVLLHIEKRLSQDRGALRDLGITAY